MTDEEYRAHPIEWRKGYSDNINDRPPKKDASKEYMEGYIYAYEHPFGPVARPM